MLVEPEDLILYLMIEADEVNQGHTYQWYDGDKVKPISYEEEVRKCVTSWRRNAGIYKKCQIVVFNCTEADVSRYTKTLFGDYNVTYIHEPMDQAKEHKCSWFNIPMVGAHLEGLFPDKYILHMDLDMYCLSEPHASIMEIPKGTVATVGKYDDDNIHDRRTIDQDFEFNCVTCWVLAHSSDGFYQRWYEVQSQLAEDLKDLPWKEYCDIEEHAVDVMYFEQGVEINFVDRFMAGPGYTDCDTINNKVAAKRICFVHAHKWQDPEGLTEKYVKMIIRTRGD
jgi:hypothetical protein